MVAERHLRVDEEVWSKLHMWKMFLRKRCLKDVLKQILEEWENSEVGVKIDLIKDSEP